MANDTYNLESRLASLASGSYRPTQSVSVPNQPGYDENNVGDLDARLNALAATEPKPVDVAPIKKSPRDAYDEMLTQRERGGGGNVADPNRVAPYGEFTGQSTTNANGRNGGAYAAEQEYRENTPWLERAQDSVTAFTANAADRLGKGVDKTLALTDVVAANFLGAGANALGWITKQADNLIDFGAEKAAEDPFWADYYKSIPDKPSASDYIYDFADKRFDEAEQNLAYAQEGLGKVGKFGTNAVVAAGGMAGDLATAAALNVAALVPMAVRTFGSATHEARKAGASDLQQGVYGVASAAVEVLTEKLFAGNPVYDGISKATLINQIVTNPRFLKVINSLPANIITEGIEEIISGFLNPILKRMAYDPTAESATAEELVEQGITGMVLSALGLSGQAIATAQTGGASSTAQTTEQTTPPITPSPITPANTESQIAVKNAPTTQVRKAPTPTAPTVESNAQIPTNIVQSETEQTSPIQLVPPTQEIQNPDIVSQISGENQTTQEQAPTVPQENPMLPQEGKLPSGMGAMSNPFIPEQKRSQAEENTLQTVESEAGVPEEIRTPIFYDVVTELESVSHAGQRVLTDMQGEMSELAGKAAWTGEDNDTSKLIRKRLQAEAERTGDWTNYSNWRDVDVAHMSEAGRALQSQYKYTRDSGEEAIAEAADLAKSAGLTQEQTNKLLNDVAGFAGAFDSIDPNVAEVETIAKSAVSDVSVYDPIGGVYEAIAKSDNHGLSVTRWLTRTADMLAAKIDKNATKTEKQDTRTTMQIILSDLVRLTKEATPQAQTSQAKGAPNTAAFQNFIQNRWQYEQAVKWAQKTIYEQYAGDPEVLAVFDEWLSNGISLGKVLSKVISEQGVKISSILTENWNNKAKAANEIKKAVLTNTSLTRKQAAEAAEMITGRFWEEVAEKSAERVASMLGDKIKAEPKTVVQRMTELYNLGAFDGKFSDKAIDRIFGKGTAATMSSADKSVLRETMGSVVEANGKKAYIDLINNVSAYRNTSTFIKSRFNKLLENRNASYLKAYAFAQLNSIAKDQIKQSPAQSIGAKMRTFQVLNLLTNLTTINRNLGGNEMFGFVDTAALDGPGVALDSLLSMFTKRREVPFSKRWLSSTFRKGAQDALEKSVLEIAGDVDMAGAENRYGQKTGRTFKMSGGPIERFYSRWEQLMGYALTSTDRFQRGGVEAEETAALRKSNERVDEDALNDILEIVPGESADYRLFQNNGVAKSISQGVHDVLNIVGVGGDGGVTRGPDGKKRVTARTGGFGLGDIVNTFPGVPANLGVKPLEYSPAASLVGLGQAVKTIIDAKQGKLKPGQQAAAVRNFSRGVTGVALVALAAALSKAGLIKYIGSDDEDYDKTATAASTGRSGMQINLDATMRWIKGEPPEWRADDDLMNIAWAAPINAFLIIGDMVANEGEDATVWDYAGDYVDGTIRAILDIPVMSSISRFYDSLRYKQDDEKYGAVLGEAAADFASDSAIGMSTPAFIRNSARGFDPFYRDTSSDNPWQEVWNKFLSGVPLARQTLPTSVDPFGETKDYMGGNPLMNFINATMLPGGITKYTPTAITNELDALSAATGKDSVYPDRKAPNSTKYGGAVYALTTKEKREWQTTAGQLFTSLVSQAMDSAPYKALTNDQKIEVLGRIEEYATDRAKKALIESRGGAYESSWDDEATVPELPKLFAYKEALSDAIGDNPSTHDYSAIDALVSNLTSEPQEIIDKLASSVSHADELVEASNVGIPSEEWYDVYKRFGMIDWKDKTVDQKATELSYFLDTETDYNDKQKSVLEEQMRYWQSFPGNAETYDKFNALGVPTDYTYQYLEARRVVPSQHSQANVYAAMELSDIPIEYRRIIWDSFGWATPYDNYRG